MAEEMVLGGSACAEEGVNAETFSDEVLPCVSMGGGIQDADVAYAAMEEQYVLVLTSTCINRLFE